MCLRKSELLWLHPVFTLLQHDVDPCSKVRHCSAGDKSSRGIALVGLLFGAGVCVQAKDCAYERQPWEYDVVVLKRLACVCTPGLTEIA